MRKEISPPEAPAIERDVLSVICYRPELIPEIEEILNEKCFYTPDYNYIFKIVMEVYFSGVEVTQSAILQKIIPTNLSYLLTVYQDLRKFFTTEKNLLTNAGILADYSVKREILTQAFRLINMIDAGDSMDEIEAEVHETETIVITRASTVDGVTMDSAINGMFELMEREVSSKGVTGIPTGIPSIDKMTGGWDADDIITFAARPGMGKTASAAFHSYFAASEGFPTAFFCFEVKPDKIAARMVSNASGVYASDITRNNMVPAQRGIVTKKGNDSRNLPLHFYDNSRSTDINDILRTIRAWVRKYGIKIVFIDYIGLMKDRTIRDQSNKTAVIESIMSKLRELRAQLRIPFIIYSQLNRGNEDRTDRRPKLHDLKHTGKIEEDSTRVIFLYRQDYYDALQSEESGEPFYPSHDMEYIFAKNREGFTGIALLKCDIGLNRFWDIGYPPANQLAVIESKEKKINVFDGVKINFDM